MMNEENSFKYSELNVKAYNLIQEREFENALGVLNDLRSLIKYMNDDTKHLEILTNQGLCFFYLGDFTKAYSYLKEAKDHMIPLIHLNKNRNKKISLVFIRIMSNLALIDLALNKIGECKNLFGAIMNFINETQSNEDKKEYLELLFNVMFNLNSLSKFYDEYQDSSPINYFHILLKERDASSWIELITMHLNKIKQDKNSSGTLFLLLNQICAYYYNTSDLGEKFESILGDLVEIFTQSNPDLSLEEIVSDFRLRMNTLLEIYHNIKEIEAQISQTAEDKTVLQDDNRILIRILLRYATNNYSHFDSRIDINQIRLAINLTYKEDFQLDKSIASLINPEIIESLNVLISNMIKIREKSRILKCFLMFKLNTLGYLSMSQKMKQKYVLSNQIMYKKFLTLSNGMDLTKVNFRTNGTVSHYYVFGLGEGCTEYSFLVFKNSNEFTEKRKPRKIVPFSTIKKITHGICSENLRKKIKTIKESLKPWLFLSLHLSSRSIDLYFQDEEQLKLWYHGLKYYHKNHNPDQIVIPTISQFILGRLKLKMIYELKCIKVEDTRNFNITNHLQGLSYDVTSYPLSFVKTLLLYVKLRNPKDLY